MPRSKSIAHYPSRYAEIILECARENKEIRVVCSSMEQTLKFKGHWYSFIGAVRASERRVQAELARAALPTPTDAQKDILDLGANANRVLVTTEGNPPTVVFQNRDHSWQAKLVGAALVSEGKDAPLTAAVENIADRLMQIQQENEDGNG